MKNQTSALLIALLLPLTMTACGIPEEQYKKDMANLTDTLNKKSAEELAAEKAKCEAARAAAEAANAATEKDRAARAADEYNATKKALDACTSRGGDAAKQLAACQIEREEAKSKLERVTASVNKVRDALKAMSDAGKLTIKVRNGFLVIALSGDILFDSGKAKLKKDAEPVLTELAGILKGMPERLFQVVSHTDDAGAEDLNWKLSMERALTVVQFLIGQGVNGKGVSAGGYAFYQPVADNTTDAGKQTNRRVEFLLIPNLSELLNLK